VRSSVVFLLALSLLTAACAGDGLRAPNAYTLVAEASFLLGHPPVAANGIINVVIEIPAGTTAKWEVDKKDGVLRWQYKKGAPRIVRYLGYPGNYGMVPRTLLPKPAGGDGEPLDVIVLGPPITRGSVVEAKLIGVLTLLDGGEQDDKLIALLEGNPLAEVDDLHGLEEQFPGAMTIIETWFVNYKGPGEMESKGYRSADEARAILDVAIAAFDTE
jgi:inorganic pyrophosphatase